MKLICRDCKYFPEKKNYAFCGNANHSGRLEIMADYPACDKYEKGKHEPLFNKNST